MSAYKKVMQFEAEIKKSAAANGFDWRLIAAIIIRESSANPYAIRVERGFWKRYSPNYKKMIPQNHPARRWLDFPDVFASSYGLMQIMFGVAYEHGFRRKFPTELLDPEINIDMGCRILERKVRISGGSIQGGLLKYNGGGDPDYPQKVMRAFSKLEKLYPN